MAFNALPDRSICQTYNARGQHSWDFLVCEGQRGWSATHVLIPFALMILTGNFFVSFTIAGAVEVFEALALTTVGSYIVFHTNDAELETKAGSLLGDWLINDLLGILMALALLRILKLPGLLRIVLDRWSWWPASSIPSEPSTFVFSNHKGLAAFLAGWTLFVLASGILPTWIVPGDCDNHVEQDCINVGLMMMVGLQVILIALGWLLWTSRWQFRLNLWERYGLVYSVMWWRIHALFAAWMAFVLMVGLQNAQPLVPLFILPVIGEWAQVWAFAFIWLALALIVLLPLMHQEKQWYHNHQKKHKSRRPISCCRYAKCEQKSREKQQSRPSPLHHHRHVDL